MSLSRYILYKIVVINYKTFIINKYLSAILFSNSTFEFRSQSCNFEANHTESKVSIFMFCIEDTVLYKPFYTIKVSVITVGILHR